MIRERVPADALPSGILHDFVYLRGRHGRYPRMAYIDLTTADLWNLRKGVWVPCGNGMWRWDAWQLEQRHLKK